MALVRFGWTRHILSHPWYALHTATPASQHTQISSSGCPVEARILPRLKHTTAVECLWSACEKCTPSTQFSNFLGRKALQLCGSLKNSKTA